MKIDKKLSSSLKFLGSINSELSRDTHFCLETLMPMVIAYGEGREDLENVTFWAKSAVRCFTNQVDGISFSMRKAVLHLEHDVDLGLTNRERAELSELKYDSKSDSVKEEFLSKGPKEILKLAFRYFPKLFGSDWKLDTNAQGWGSFTEILKARNKITHPSRIERLYPVEIYAHLVPSIVWFYTTMLGMLAECAARLGLSFKRDNTTFDVKPFRGIPDLKIEPDPSFYKRIEEYGSDSLKYVNEMMRKLSSDTMRALDLLSEGLRKAPAKHAKIRLPPRVVFAGRLSARTLFSEVEGMTAALSFFIAAAEKRSEVAISKEDREALVIFDGRQESKFDECERLAVVGELFSKFFGDGGQTIDRQGSDWKKFQICRGYRNRITHPRDLEDLDLKLGTIESLAGAMGWYANEFLNAISIDADRWSSLMKDASIEEILPAAEPNEANDAQEELY